MMTNQTKYHWEKAYVFVPENFPGPVFVGQDSIYDIYVAYGW